MVLSAMAVVFPARQPLWSFKCLHHPTSKALQWVWEKAEVRFWMAWTLSALDVSPGSRHSDLGMSHLLFSTSRCSVLSFLWYIIKVHYYSVNALKESKAGIFPVLRTLKEELIITKEATKGVHYHISDSSVSGTSVNHFRSWCNRPSKKDNTSLKPQKLHQAKKKTHHNPIRFGAIRPLSLHVLWF